MMKTVCLIILFLGIFHIDGYSQKNREKHIVKADTVTVDSIEYKLIVLDPRFESWVVTQPPMNFYSKEYYEQRNRLYVSEWNQRYMTHRGPIEYETYIDYDPRIDYGIDLNYRLYYYFKYFEMSNHVRLINSVR